MKRDSIQIITNKYKIYFLPLFLYKIFLVATVFKELLMELRYKAQSSYSQAVYILGCVWGDS